MADGFFADGCPALVVKCDDNARKVVGLGAWADAFAADPIVEIERGDCAAVDGEALQRVLEG